ncbi:MAG: NAD(P)-binding protein [Betaproteobacteria bacterium]|nr:NAD(P)-binding protein [Betaproteobacteria bacterium]
MDAKIMIIGAGIGEAAAALALQRRGFRVAVYEKAKQILEVSAGVIITANARRACTISALTKTGSTLQLVFCFSYLPLRNRSGAASGHQ